VIFMVLSTAFFVGTGNSIFGTISQAFRSIVFRVSSAWFFANYLDITLIWWFQTASNIGGSFVAAIFFVYLLKLIKMNFNESSAHHLDEN
jgi:Na+-driven multidrug efflux pump